jgi:hypothetical protein
MLSQIHQSNLDVINAAKATWVCRKWNQKAMLYEFTEAHSEYAPAPVWPDYPFEEIVELAYKERIIDSEKHPVYLELIGKKAITD